MTPRALQRLAGAVALTLSVLAGGLVAAAPAQAAACPGTSGVTVVVDFGRLGGTSVRCAAGSPASGLAALSAAGFSIAYVQTQPGFVCRVNGLPTPAADPCRRTPPATAYWSYWHASRGGGWQYSSTGAASRRPAAGSVEGWAFGAGSRPGVAPPAAARPAPSATTRTTRTTRPHPSTTTSKTSKTSTTSGSTPRPTSSGTDHGSATTTSGATSGTTRTTDGATTAPAAGSAASGTGPTATTAVTSATSASTTTGANGPSDPTAGATTADPQAAADDGAGSPTGALVGVGIVLVLAAGAALLVRRRRAG